MLAAVLDVNPKIIAWPVQLVAHNEGTVSDIKYFMP